MYLCIMKRRKKKNTSAINCVSKLIGIFVLTITLSLAPTIETNAQCPMCRMSAQKNLDGGGTAGSGLNKGILYMLMLPYVIVGGVGYVWYRNRKNVES